MNNYPPQAHRGEGESVLAFDGVTVARAGSDLIAKVDWQVHSNQRWVILGPNGAGKTTLLSIAAAMMHPTSGTAQILGERLGAVDVFELRPRIGFSSVRLAERIPPGELVFNAVLTSAYAVVGRYVESYDAMDELRARTLLEQLGIARLAERRYATLSEGERKRVQIARALMADPELVLLDEPAAGLDLGAREDLLRRLGELATDPTAPTLVLVTHHVEEIPPGITHALLLNQGQVVAGGSISDVLTDDNLTATFDTPIRLRRDNGRYFAQAA